MEELKDEASSDSENQEIDVTTIEGMLEGDFDYQASNLEKHSRGDIFGQNQQTYSSENLTIVKQEEIDLGSEIIVDDAEIKIERHCLICRKKKSKWSQKKKWFECRNANCVKTVCIACKMKSRKMKRKKTFCLTCGEQYLGGHSKFFQQCRKCMYWRCISCCKVSRCRCLIISAISQHCF